MRRKDRDPPKDKLFCDSLRGTWFDKEHRAKMQAILDNGNDEISKQYLEDVVKKARRKTDKKPEPR